MALASATEITQALSTTGWGYVSLHTASPGTTNATASANEVTGGTYARVAVTWTASIGGSAASNSGPLSINLPASTTATHFGIWSAASAGTYYIGGALSPSVTTSTSAGVVTIAAAALTVSAS
jgi:hypothetical protein